MGTSRSFAYKRILVLTDYHRGLKTRALADKYGVKYGIVRSWITMFNSRGFSSLPMCEFKDDSEFQLLIYDFESVLAKALEVERDRVISSKDVQKELSSRGVVEFIGTSQVARLKKVESLITYLDNNNYATDVAINVGVSLPTLKLWYEEYCEEGIEAFELVDGECELDSSHLLSELERLHTIRQEGCPFSSYSAEELINALTDFYVTFRPVDDILEKYNLTLKSLDELITHYKQGKIEITPELEVAENKLFYASKIKRDINEGSTQVSSGFTEKEIIAIIERSFEGESVKSLLAEFNITSSSFYRWRKKYANDGYIKPQYT